MKVAFVGNSQGNLALLERTLISLVDRHEVKRIYPLDSTADDVDAVLRARNARFPAEVEWTDPTYADFVLAAVLQGAVEVPAEEVGRTERVSRRVATPRGLIELGGVKVAVTGAGGASRGEAQVVVSPQPGRRLVDSDGTPRRVCPGHLRADEWEGEPATCVLIEAAGGAVRVTFVAPDGEQVGSPLALRLPGR